MPLPAARDRRILWLVAVLATVLALLPAAAFAQDAPTLTPMASSSGSVTLPPTERALPGYPLDCPIPGETGAVSPADEPITDYAIVLDVSRSMVGDYLLSDGSGYGNDPTKNIFPQVKNAVVGYIESLKPEANIILIPFADGVREDQMVVIDGRRETSTQEAIDAVNAAVADGTGTFITQAMTRATDELEALKNSTPGKTRYQTILLFTDGEGTGTDDKIDGNPSVDVLLKRLDAYRTEQPYLFVKYVALGHEVPNSSQLRDHGVTVVEEPTGRVTPIREVSLTLLGRDFGIVGPGQEIPTRLCITGGTSISELPVTLTVGGVNGQVPPIELETESALISSAGADVRWRIPDDGSATLGDFVGFLEISDEDAELLLLPERLPVTFRIVPPTSTPTPAPTATFTPTSTPIPTLTPTASPTPTATESPTPTATATPVPGAVISLGDFDGTVKVSLKDDPKATKTWRAPVTFNLQPGAAPVVSVADVTGDPALPTPIGAHFEVDGKNKGASLELRAGMGKTELVLDSDAGNLQSLGEIDPATLIGQVNVNPKGAAVTLPNGECRAAGDCVLPFTAKVKVYSPVNWMPILLGLLALLLAGGAAAAVWAARPVLPKNAAVVTGSGRRLTSMALGDHQTGFLPKAVSVGGNGSNVNVGAGSQIGEIHGKWGFPHKAFLTVDGAASGVRVDNQPVQPNGTVHLGGGSQIKMGNRTFRYSQEPLN